jgi:two-component system response regulator
LTSQGKPFPYSLSVYYNIGNFVFTKKDLLQNRTISILMADDDLDDQYLVRRAVEDINIGHELHTVNNGSQLLDRLLKTGLYSDAKVSRPDCIVLDLNMPLVDGFQALHKIKSHESISDIPVFVLSTSRSDRDRLRSLELGARDFYRKPAQYAELKKIMGDICVKVGESNLANKVVA